MECVSRTGNTKNNLYKNLNIHRKDDNCQTKYLREGVG
jgi:hypothetical protein